MADQKLVDLLRQGADVWNKWRFEQRDAKIFDLTGADLDGANLREAYLGGAVLAEAHLRGASLAKAFLRDVNLSGADLIDANLEDADLGGAILTGANLGGAILSYAYLDGAVLSKANLYEARLGRARLRGADLSSAHLASAYIAMAELNSANLAGADLTSALVTMVELNSAKLVGARLVNAMLTTVELNWADLREANLTEALLMGVGLEGTRLEGATLKNTVFAGLNLAPAIGLESVRHDGPSTIGIDTIYLSQGNIPDIFLQRAGVPESFITYACSLVVKPIELYSCFISYSSKDQRFAERLYADLQARNVRCWFAPEDMKIGDPIRDRIDQSIRMYDKLLLVLSENSIRSMWVENEVEAALERELQLTKQVAADAERPTVLFPIRLDDAINETPLAWAATIRRQRHIGDFSGWKDHDSYQKALTRLLRDLKVAGG